MHQQYISPNRRRIHRANDKTSQQVQDSWVGWFAVDANTTDVEFAFDQWIDQCLPRIEQVSLNLKKAIQAWRLQVDFFMPTYPCRSIIFTYENDKAEIFSHPAKVKYEGIFERNAGWTKLITQSNQIASIFILTLDQDEYKLYEICENGIELRIQIDVHANQRYKALSTFISSVRIYYSNMNGPLIVVGNTNYNTELDCWILAANLNVQSYWQKDQIYSLHEIINKINTKNALMYWRRQWIKMISKSANDSNKIIQKKEMLLESIKKDKIKYLMVPNHYNPQHDDIEIIEASFKKHVCIMKYDETILSGVHI